MTKTNKRITRPQGPHPTQGSRVPPMTAPVLAGLALAFKVTDWSAALCAWTPGERAHVDEARAWLRAVSGQHLPDPKR